MACLLSPRLCRCWIFAIAIVASFQLFVAGPFVCAQNFDATNLHDPLDLTAIWLVQGGDNPSYARPDFDDSNWTHFDSESDIKTIFPQSRPEVVWYRLRVKVSPGQTDLALREFSLSHAFEIYANGERLIASGQVSPYHAYTIDARILKKIPAGLLSSGSMVIALRVHFSRSEWRGEGPGFSSANLRIGPERTLYLEDWLAVIGENASGIFGHFLAACLAFVGLAFFIEQRRQTEYLWLFALGFLALAEVPVPFVATFHDVPLIWEFLSNLLYIGTPYCFVSLYFCLVNKQIGWRWRIILIVTGLLNSVFMMVGGDLFALPSTVKLIIAIPYWSIISIVMPAVLIAHFRRGNRDAGILLIPVILLSLNVYAVAILDALGEFSPWRSIAIRGWNIIGNLKAGPFSFSVLDVAEISAEFSLAAIMILRSTRTSRRQAHLEGEVAAAREVQRVIVPEQIQAFGGFHVESVYQPAQQVGGDFFQILPTDEDGLLIVVGDVAGKGLPAAMLVSVLVGAIRGVAEYTKDPAELLANLNERLVGRGGGGFSTALVALIEANGLVTIANAGHLSPYLDGEEVELLGALPLGAVSGVTYETTRIQLAPGSRLTFYSDGVIEAQRPNGELFGFERAREVSMKPAAEIVETAKRFGQEDDITVVTVRRTAAVASAA